MEQWKLISVQEVDSTNSVLKTMEDAPHGTVLCAQRQSGGRGRLGRSFCSPEGGLYLSVLLRRGEPLAELLHLTPMAAVAVRRAILDACAVDTQIKWINDLYKDGRKVCGILTEVAPQGGVILGIGINCNVPAFPPELREIAGSLHEFCGAVDQEALLRRLIQGLQELDRELFSSKKVWMEEYAAHCLTLSREVLLIRGEEQRRAFALSLDENGALLVRLPDGTTETVTTGEVSVRPQSIGCYNVRSKKF